MSFSCFLQDQVTLKRLVWAFCLTSAQDSAIPWLFPSSHFLTLFPLLQPPPFIWSPSWTLVTALTWCPVATKRFTPTPAPCTPSPSRAPSSPPRATSNPPLWIRRWPNLMNHWSPTLTQRCLSRPPPWPPSPSWSSTSLAWLISTAAGSPPPPLTSPQLPPLVRSYTEAFALLVKFMVPPCLFLLLRAAVQHPPSQEAASLRVSPCWETQPEWASALLGKRPPGTQLTWATFLQQLERTWISICISTLTWTWPPV